MAVYRLFKNEPFEPEAIVSMTRVYADVCRTLGLSDADHHESNVVAVKVIEFPATQKLTPQSMPIMPVSSAIE